MSEQQSQLIYFISTLLLSLGWLGGCTEGRSCFPSLPGEMFTIKTCWSSPAPSPHITSSLLQGIFNVSGEKEGLTAISLDSHRGEREREQESCPAVTQRDWLSPEGDLGCWVASGQTGFPRHPKQQLLGELCQQSCWPEMELNNMINAWSPGGITRRESKDSNPTLDGRNLTPNCSWLQELLIPAFLFTLDVSCMFGFQPQQAFCKAANSSSGLFDPKLEYLKTVVRSLCKEWERFL